MVIHEIKKAAADRCTVILENGTEIRSSLNVISEYRLSSGKALDEDELAAFTAASERMLAREKALELVSRRLMSGKELRDKLLQRGMSEETSDYCVDWLSENGFLDDGSYALAVARHYAEKGYGAGRVRSELSKRGIPRELWEAAMDAMPETDDKLLGLIHAKLKDPNDREQIRKISNALYRRGYSWDEIRTALSRCSAEYEDY